MGSQTFLPFLRGSIKEAQGKRNDNGLHIEMSPLLAGAEPAFLGF
nr:MAG TPA: hypothetical protein [Bacteriophage sp.]